MMGVFSMGSVWVILAVILVAVILLARGPLGKGKSEAEGVSSAQSALEVLNMRYASGEINKQEFDEKKRGLMP